MTTKTNKIKNLRDWVLSDYSNDHHNRIINDLFNALFVEQQEGRVIDHTPNIRDIMTLDIIEAQSLMTRRREGDYSQTDIIEALKGLEHPKIIINRGNGITHTYSNWNGKQIAAVKLDYSHPFILGPTMPEKDIAAEVAQVDLTETPVDEIDKCDASRRWIDYAMTLEQQYAIDQETIVKLRAVITELSEVLHEVDSEARISLTSSELLELMQSNSDTADTPF